MSLMANLYVGQSGLITSQSALNTTAHNLANIDTEGFTRQQVSQGTRDYQTLEKNARTVAWKQVGNGVNYNNCKQVRSDFLPDFTNLDFDYNDVVLGISYERTGEREIRFL